jgi:murein DD-endopeptidase MepM/ murein hydrolase activator NlpD
MHNGIDIGVNFVPVYASASGTAFVRDMPGGGYGNQVMINHHNGFCTLYAHLNQYYVSDGQSVSQGQVIGQSGDTGSSGYGSYAPHLHFEIRKINTDSIYEYYGMTSENPLEYLSGDYSTVAGWDVES